MGRVFPYDCCYLKSTDFEPRLDQRLDVGGLFDLRALVVTARVRREHRRAVDDAHLMWIGEHRQNAPDMREWH